MTKLYLLLTVYCLLFTALCKGQINLVPNPSFEAIYSCPTQTSYLIDTAVGWSTLKNGGGGAPDLYNVCALGTMTGVPVNGSAQGFQFPHSGNGYAGIGVGDSVNHLREYIQSKLLQKLNGGKLYCVKFYVSFFNTCKVYIKPLGAYLDSGSVFAPTFWGLAIANPQVYNLGQPLSDTLNWMKIQGSFVATGIETYITIGNFFTNAASDIHFVSGIPSYWSSYYYIDDVSVIDVSTPAHAGNDTTIIPGDSVFIGRPQEVGLNEDCIWYVNNQPIDTVAGFWVRPELPTTYVLQQTICGTVTYDTVKVNVSGVGVNELKVESYELKVFPNPSNGSFTLSFESKILNCLSPSVKFILQYL